MSDFNFLEYQDALNDLKNSVKEMNEAIDGLQFEHGANGITDRAETYLQLFLDARKDTALKQRKVADLIVKDRVRVNDPR
jgi:hypothetical protein